MTSSLRVLTASTLDSNPSLLLIAADGSKTLINCGEGCQRSFLESGASPSAPSPSPSPSTSTSVRASSVHRICLTHIGHDALGGLPGMILTTADVAENAARDFQRKKGMSDGNGRNGMMDGGNNSRKRKDLSFESDDKSRNGNGSGKGHEENEQDQEQDQDREKEGLADLEIIGPQGTKHFLHSLRHFMRRDRFKIHAHEGSFDSSTCQNENSTTSCNTHIPPRKKNKKMKSKRGRNDRSHDASQNVGFHVKTLAINYPVAASSTTTASSSSSSSALSPTDNDKDDANTAIPTKITTTTTGRTKQALSYLFTTPPIPGKFLVEKARQKNIPPGPLYAQLKAGKTVTFVDPTTKEERTVRSEEVVAKASPGVAVAVVFCPLLEVLGELREADMFCDMEESERKRGDDEDPLGNTETTTITTSKTAAATTNTVELDVIVHMTPKSVFDHPSYQSWCRRFGNRVDHITLHVPETLEARTSSSSSSTSSPDGGSGADSPFCSAVRGGIRRSLLSDEVFPRPRLQVGMKDDEVTSTGERNEKDYINGKNTETMRTIEGCPMMEYHLIPRAKSGLNETTKRSPYAANEIEVLTEEVHRTGAVTLAKQLISTTNFESNGTKQTETGGTNTKLGELIFSGTGSAIPCKHRNVTGMYLRMDNGNAILLDAGEGTVGQLIQSWKSSLPSQCTSQTAIEEYHSRLRGIKAVWISHPHADHHLGLLRLLSERNAICGQNDPIVLMAPPNMFAFLSEYAFISPEIQRGYIAVDCRDMMHGKNHPVGRKLYEDLGVTNCMSVPVAHCPHSFAVVIDGTSFGRVAYSGDCRPSNRFADVAFGADLLIHEATFEDGMEEEAVMKRHSTVGEAIDVARRMNAKALMLTHFSQRYPKIPPLKRSLRNGESLSSQDDDFSIAFAFDFMRVRPNTIATAAILTPALRLLYPGNGDDNDMDLELSKEGKDSAKELMNVPGLFAAKGIL
ncbi:hypothetical protein ACHAXS_005596 [Conticribra weissflogii]